MFKGNQTCLVYTLAGTDVYGQPTLNAPVKESCAVVKLDAKAMKTPLRGSQSGTHGAAFEEQEAASMMFTSTTSVALDSIVQIAGIKLRVIGKLPQFDVFGNVDHYEVSLAFWG